MDSRPSLPHRPLVALLALLAIGVGVLFALADVGAFTEEGGAIFDLAWGRAALADLAAGLILAILWIHYREKSVSKALLWTVAVLGLGNLATLIYAIRAAVLSRGDAIAFFTGRDIESPEGSGVVEEAE